MGTNKALKYISYQQLKKELDKSKKENKVSLFCKTYLLNESFIDEHVDCFDLSCWLEICDYQTISETFIEKHIDKISWRWISEKQTLSETFMHKYRDKINWRYASLYQRMSLEFIMDHISYVYVGRLQKNPLVDQNDLNEKNIWVIAMLMEGEIS